jgi:hypothetical protein
MGTIHANEARLHSSAPTRHAHSRQVEASRPRPPRVRPPGFFGFCRSAAASRPVNGPGAGGHILRVDWVAACFCGARRVSDMCVWTRAVVHGARRAENAVGLCRAETAIGVSRTSDGRKSVEGDTAVENS